MDYFRRGEESREQRPESTELKGNFSSVGKKE
jgi:hypothetical protein